MNKRQFMKTIRFERLAKTDDWEKFMLKSYLLTKLMGGKIKEIMSLYAVGRVTAVNVPFAKKVLNIEIKTRKRALYDLDLADMNKIISKEEIITLKTIYYINKPVEIKPVLEG